MIDALRAPQLSWGVSPPRSGCRGTSDDVSCTRAAGGMLGRPLPPPMPPRRSPFRAICAVSPLVVLFALSCAEATGPAPLAARYRLVRVAVRPLPSPPVPERQVRGTGGDTVICARSRQATVLHFATSDHSSEVAWIDSLSVVCPDRPSVEIRAILLPGRRSQVGEVFHVTLFLQSLMPLREARVYFQRSGDTLRTYRRESLQDGRATAVDDTVLVFVPAPP
jgi:hypothetical protein